MPGYIKKILLLIILFSAIAYPQGNSTGKLIAINILPTYQSWEVKGDSKFSEFTNIFSFNYLPARNTNVSFTTRYASVGGDLNKLSGLSDIQLFISQRMQKYNLALNAGLNVPSGKTKLSQEEFITSRVISQNIFNLKTSNFGQGLNIFFGATWTYPFSDNFVIGAGLSYQVKGKYQPIDFSSEKYEPSNEVSATAGFDTKLNSSSTLSGDFTAIFYGSDKVDGQKIFSTGSRLIFSSLFKQYFGYNILSALVLFRYVGADKLENVNPLLENEKFNPNQFYFGVGFNQRFTPQFRLQYEAAINVYEKSSAPFSGYTLYGISLSPELILSSSVTIPIVLRYFIGSAKDKPDLKNYELGTGIKITF